jgi:hypothetical protein
MRNCRPRHPKISGSESSIRIGFGIINIGFGFGNHRPRIQSVRRTVSADPCSTGYISAWAQSAGPCGTGIFVVRGPVSIGEQSLTYLNIHFCRFTATEILHFSARVLWVHVRVAVLHYFSCLLYKYFSKTFHSYASTFSLGYSQMWLYAYNS